MLGCAGLGYPQHGASHVTPLYQPRCLGSTCIRRLACRWQRQEKQQLRNPAAKAQPLEDFVALDVEFVHFKVRRVCAAMCCTLGASDHRLACAMVPC